MFHVCSAAACTCSAQKSHEKSSDAHPTNFPYSIGRTSLCVCVCVIKRVTVYTGFYQGMGGLVNCIGEHAQRRPSRARALSFLHTLTLFLAHALSFFLSLSLAFPFSTSFAHRGRGQPRPRASTDALTSPVWNQSAVCSSLHLHGSSLESGNLWHKFKVSRSTIWSHCEG